VTELYQTFLRNKAMRVRDAGIEPAEIHKRLFPFQAAIVQWACKRGRAAIWADTGLGKTLMQLEWARQIGGRTLILAPLAVAHQTVEEARNLGLPLTYIKEPAEWADTTIQRCAITNYERLDAFADTPLDAVVLDESSILKSLTGKTRRKLIERFADVPYRLACTATPAPNDYLELGNHAQFLGIMSWAEMAATFFVHDAQSKDGTRGHQSGAWRLKGHAQDEFWRWLVSWGVFIKHPSDIGFEETRFRLPELSIKDNVVPVDVATPGHLFFTGLHGVQDRNRMRQSTLKERVARAAKLIRREPKEQWLAWCGLNDEADAMEGAIGKRAVQVKGSEEPEAKAEKLLAFARGEIKVLVTKPKIAGFGMNFQRCARQVFVGLGDSYEQYYQCIRRSWRFGQTRPVNVHLVVTDAEAEIVQNVRRKEQDAATMSREMVARMADLETREVRGASRSEESYMTDMAQGDYWTLYQGDCVETMRKLKKDIVDLSVYSPPFASLYTYTASSRDMGNCKNEDQFFEHFRFFTKELLRVTKPGRLTCCHVAQLAAMASRDGYIGLKDFRGRCIQTFIEAGWIHHGEIAIDKNPQAQAIRTKSKALLFVQLRKDSSWLRPAIADAVLLFRKPGDNAVPIKPEISNEDWIKWAHPLWTDIRETNVLQYRDAREDKDEKHICPLQLDVIERCVRLWSNPGEVVLSPFAGVGSEGYQAVKYGRRFIGIELKRSYWETAKKNLHASEQEMANGTLFPVKQKGSRTFRYTGNPGDHPELEEIRED